VISLADLRPEAEFVLAVRTGLCTARPAGSRTSGAPWLSLAPFHRRSIDCPF
jgi:hypothetical protein